MVRLPPLRIRDLIDGYSNGDGGAGGEGDDDDDGDGDSHH